MHKKLASCLMLAFLLINIAAISFCIASDESFPITDSQNTPKSASNSTLYYDDFKYDKLNASTSDNISWSFSSANASVKITVMAMNNGNFSLFNSSQPFIYTTLSSGNLTSDNGTFSPKYPDIWCIIFFNNDTDMQQSTILSYNTKVISTITNITITSPDNSSYWMMGSYYYIRWNTIGNISNVDIYLFKNGTHYFMIAANVPNNGSYFWNLPMSLDLSYYYQIMICDINTTTTYYLSSYFSIVAKASFEITTPISTSSWNGGYSYHIYWRNAGSIPRVNIFLYKEGEYYRTIITDLNNEGSYFWTLPSYLPSSGSYQIKIEDANNLLMYCYSDEFSINVNSGNSSPNFVPISYNIGIIVFFSLFLLVLLIFLGVRSRNKPRPSQPKINDEYHKISQESRRSLVKQQVSESGLPFDSQKSSLESNISILPNICPRCGTMVNNKAKFCYECGYILKKDY